MEQGAQWVPRIPISPSCLHSALSERGEGAGGEEVFADGNVRGFFRAQDEYGISGELYAAPQIGRPTCLSNQVAFCLTIRYLR
jgi:hypothetical protein